MKTYKFFQQYNWGPGWDGEITIPDSAVFYNMHGEEWYILIPSNDIDTVIKDKGCVQVRCYNLLDYTIVYLNNIIAEDWPDVGKAEFDDLFTKLFAGVYVYRYKQAMFEVEFNKNANSLDEYVTSKEVSPETLISCKRLVALSSDASVECIRVGLNNQFDLSENYFIDKAEIRLCDMEEFSYDNKFKTVVSTDPTLYNEKRLEVINHLR